MARQCKEYVPFSLKLDKSLNEKLEQVCGETRLSKTAIVELSLQDYFAKYDKERKIKVIK